ncbi:hypothetical protein ACJJTC_003811 [Scirpophaga incertulas]
MEVLFNFVGKLLGPKGNSLKRLQEDTMCKMAVLGRGSMKDRQKEEELRVSGDPKFAHLSDDLHVEISAFATPAEAHARIAYALAELRRFLVPDYNDDIRQEQMLEMQILSTQTEQRRPTPPETSRCGSEEALQISANKQRMTGLQQGAQPMPQPLAPGGLAAGGLPASALAGGLAPGGLAPGGLAPGGLATGGLATGGLAAGGLATGALSAGLSAGNLPAVSLAAGLVGPAREFSPPTPNAADHLSAHHQLAAGHTGVLVGGGVLQQPPTHHLLAQNSLLGGGDILGLSSPVLGGMLHAHPALRGVKPATVHALATQGAGGAGPTSAPRKRPLLGGARAAMSPTKRTVMTLLARARAATHKHAPAWPAPHEPGSLLPLMRDDFVAGVGVNINLA